MKKFFFVLFFVTCVFSFNMAYSVGYGILEDSHNTEKIKDVVLFDIHKPKPDLTSINEERVSNEELCQNDGFVCLVNIKSSDYNTIRSKFRTVRLDLSSKYNNTNMNYVSVVLLNLTTGSTSWRSNRIQTLPKSVGNQIRDNTSADVDITTIGKLVPGSDNLYEYTFGSEMEIVSVDGNVDKTMVWLKLKSGDIGAIPTLGSTYLQCPDDKHPHMIDLGLPSGTKWACCNVGANSPDDYGNLYAWGETSMKKDYCMATYKKAQKSNSQQGIYDFHHNSGYWSVKNLGKSISGLNDDVAHMKWGGRWQMPTLEQFMELIKNCSFEWATANGIYCGVFTGTNGGRIFMPASGAYRETEIIYREETGFYWSGSSDPNVPYNAHYLYFDEENAYVSNHSRDRGHSIRPVCK